MGFTLCPAVRHIPHPSGSLRFNKKLGQHKLFQVKTLALIAALMIALESYELKRSAIISPPQNGKFSQYFLFKK
jgi:hypothetical protein